MSKGWKAWFKAIIKPVPRCFGTGGTRYIATREENGCEACPYIDRCTDEDSRVHVAHFREIFNKE